MDFDFVRMFFKTEHDEDRYARMVEGGGIDVDAP